MIVEWGDLTGGPSGLSGVERLGVASFRLYAPGIRYYFLVYGVVVLCVVLAHNLVNSRTGRALRAIHGSEIAARTLGVDAARLKLHVFVLSAVLAALGGALYVHYLGFVAPASCGFLYSIQLVTMVVVGGMATIWGSVLGACILTVLPQVLTFLEEYDILVYGLILILMVLFMPEGIGRATLAAARRFRGKKAGIRAARAPEEK
jgi:branched-chain amino acid transport system permease protein